MKISVCIPSYNQAQYLKLSVLSAAKQTLKPFEIIVSNDCSTDNTVEVLNELSLEVPELVIVNQPVNLGIAANADTCLRMGTGEYIIRLDSDDYLLPTYCEKLSKLLLDYPEAGYAHAAVLEIDQYNNVVKKRLLARTFSFQSSEDALKAASKGYRVTANILMFKKSALVKVNYLCGRPNYVEDFHLNVSLSAAGFANVYCNEILAYYRVWVDSNRVRQKRKLMEIEGVKKVYEDLLEPEFYKRNWNLKKFKRDKENYVCRNTDCLSWKVYSNLEKKEIKNVLWSISSSKKIRAYTWMNLNGFGKPVEIISILRYKMKSFLKTIFFPPTKYKFQ